MTVKVGTGSGVVDLSQIKVGGVDVERIMVGTGSAAVEVWSSGLKYLETALSSNAAGGATGSADLPAGRQVGDLMVLIVSVYNEGMTTPAGWTRFQTDAASTRNRLHGAWRICDGTEGSTVSVTVSGSDSTAYGVMLFRGAHSTAPINVSDSSGSTISSTSHVAPTVTTTSAAPAGKAIVVRVATTYVPSANTSNYSWPAGVTEVVDYVAPTAGDSTLAALGVATAPAGAVGAQGAVTATSAVSQRWVGWSFVVSPKP